MVIDIDGRQRQLYDTPALWHPAGSYTNYFSHNFVVRFITWESLVVIVWAGCVLIHTASVAKIPAHMFCVRLCL